MIDVTWFCWVLLIFTVLWSLFQKPVITLKKQKPIFNFSYVIVLSTIMIPINYLSLLLNHKLGSAFLGMNMINYIPTYIVSFYLGVLFFKHKWLNQINKQIAILSITTFILIYYFTCIYNYPEKLFTILDTFMALSMILFLIFVFKSSFNFNTKLTRILAKTSFPAYVVQFIPLTYLYHYVVPHLSWNPWLIALFIGAVATIVSFILGIILYRLPIFRRIF